MVFIGLNIEFSFHWYDLGSNNSSKANLYIYFDPIQIIKVAFERYLGHSVGRGHCSLNSPEMKWKSRA